MREAADVLSPPGSLPKGGDYEVVGEFQPYTGAPSELGLPTGRRVVRVVAPLKVEDDERRKDADGAIAAFTKSRHLPAYVQDLKQRIKEVDNVFHAELTWRSGAWELWVDAKYDSGSDPKLRLRYDPDKEQIVDARIVFYGFDASDDPDFSREPSPYLPPDEVLTP